MPSYVVEKKLKKGIKYYVVHNIPNALGGGKPWYPCDNEKDAVLLQYDINSAEKEGRLYVPPKKKKAIKYANVESSSDSIRGLSVENLVDMYIKKMAVERWTARTLEISRSIQRNYINPYIGELVVVEVTPLIIQNYYNDLPNHKAAQGNNKQEPKNISARTVREVHKVLRPAFKFAVAILGIIPFNPVAPVTLPKLPKRKKCDRWGLNDLREALND